MRWARDNAAWLFPLLSLAAGAVGLYARAALAETNGRVAVLEALRKEDAADIVDLARKVDDIHRWMMEDRRERGKQVP